MNTQPIYSNAKTVKVIYTGLLSAALSKGGRAFSYSSKT
jgi:hypothetical protein